MYISIHICYHTYIYICIHITYMLPHIRITYIYAYVYVHAYNCKIYKMLTLSLLRYLLIMCLNSNASNGSRGPRSLACSLAELFASTFYRETQQWHVIKLWRNSCDITRSKMDIAHHLTVDISVTSTDTRSIVTNLIPTINKVDKCCIIL